MADASFENAAFQTDLHAVAGAYSIGRDPAKAATMEQDRKIARDDDGLSAGAVGREQQSPDASSHQESDRKGGKLMPRPDQGRGFPEALEASMRDHRNVYAALAK